MTCTHTHTTERSTHGYTGSVAVYPYTEENRCAHGGITVEVECCACGARRSENLNGRHVEVSPWRGSRAERAAEAERARTTLRSMARPAPITLTRGEQTAEVSLDDEGYLVVSAIDSHRVRDAVIAALPAAYVAAAQAYRRAVLAVEERGVA